jgi:hypothetical protein
MRSLEELFQYGDAVLYGYREKDLPDVLSSQKQQGRVFVFVRKDRKDSDTSYNECIRKYRSVLDVGWEPGDVCLLDKEAIKGMVLGFPSASPYVLVSLDVPIYWPWLVIGLLRRIIIGQVRVERIQGLNIGKKSRKWLVLKRRQESLKNPMFFSSEIGVQGLLDYLRKEDISYVVPRFFQKLPKLFRQGGDIDILVSDEDEARLRTFIVQHPGTIRIDIWSVSTPIYNGISYYLPPLAKKIIASAVDGPVGSRIPAPREAFLSFIYHALYHKGVNSGIPSSLPGIEVRKNPESDYSGMILNMANDLGVKVGKTMEELDEYLFREGWRPKIDTLAKIADWNEWAHRRFFGEKSIDDVRFSVFILKEKAEADDLVKPIIAVMEKEGFRVIRTKKLEGSEQVYAAEHLRGGTWAEGKNSKEGKGFMPAFAIIIWDIYGNGQGRFRILKEKIRSMFDRESISIVHSTDNTREAWDYIDICFPREQGAIKNEIASLQENSYVLISHRIKSIIKLLPYYKRRLLSKAKQILIHFLTK